MGLARAWDKDLCIVQVVAAVWIMGRTLLEWEARRLVRW